MDRRRVARARARVIDVEAAATRGGQRRERGAKRWAVRRFTAGRRCGLHGIRRNGTDVKNRRPAAGAAGRRDVAL